MSLLVPFGELRYALDFKTVFVDKLIRFIWLDLLASCLRIMNIHGTTFSFDN